MTPLDRSIARVTASLARSQRPSPALNALSAIRHAALSSTLSRHRAAAAALQPALIAGDPSARDALAALADRALAELRADVRARARAALVHRALIAADDAWRTDADELMDDPTLSDTRRTRIIERLDRWNHLIDAYRSFVVPMRPLMRDVGPTRVLDLAAGHGGFALALAEVARADGLDLSITATDLRQEYLDVGRAQAQARGLDISFRVQDALDLSNLAPDEADLVVCTQALHHFPAGLVAVMFEAATRAAARGVVFVDGCRSATNALPLAAFGLTLLASADFVHDGVLSLRRFYVPEELALLARIGPWGDDVEAMWIKPGHCLLRWTRSPS